MIKKFILVEPIWLPVLFLFFFNELGAVIDPGMGSISI